MYRNVGPCGCNSGLLSEVGLSSQWSSITGFTVLGDGEVQHNLLCASHDVYLAL